VATLAVEQFANTQEFFGARRFAGCVEFSGEALK
jgi:hypothetical protein